MTPIAQSSKRASESSSWLSTVRVSQVGHWLWLAALCGSLGCREQPGPTGEHLKAAAPPREFQVRGIVKRLDLEERSVMIQHEEIPGFMAAMTMPFRVKATNELTGVKAGDAVSFRLKVTEDESWIDQLATVGTAPPSSQAEPPTAPVAPATNSPASLSRHPLLDFAFTNELGQPVRLGDLRGQALAITFIFTRCPIPDYCPRLSKNFEEAVRKLRQTPDAPTNWHFLSVTFDPETDTPAVLKAYGQRYAYDPRYWSFLTGPKDKITELAKLSDVSFERDGVFFNHNMRTLIIDPTGQLRMNFPIGGNLADAIVGEIIKAASTTNSLPATTGTE